MAFHEAVTHSTNVMSMDKRVIFEMKHDMFGELDFPNYLVIAARRFRRLCSSTFRVSVVFLFVVQLMTFLETLCRRCTTSVLKWQCTAAW